MLDTILSIIALACFAAFLAILGWWVLQPALCIILAMGVVLAAVDFWLEQRANGGDRR